MQAYLRIMRELNEGEKLPLQAKQIVDIITAGQDVAGAHPDGMAKEAVIEELAKVITTRQPVERVLAFYCGTLGPKGTGLICVTKVGPTKAEVAAEKKAAADKAAADKPAATVVGATA